MSQPTSQLPTTDLGPYYLEGLLGRGGMGEVYLAVDQRLGRRVAIKHLTPALADNEQRRRRFRNERSTLARLSHPAIVQIFDLVETDDGEWIVMELVSGPTVAELLKEGPLLAAQVVDIGQQLAEGLAEAHDHGVLHRDLKAENVMLHRSTSASAGRASAGRASAGRASAGRASAGRASAGRASAGRASAGRAKILDFGLAKILEESDESKLSMSGQILGTCRAMSPEQACGLPLDPRSDLFSLGILLYEMVTGEPPFRGETNLDTLRQIAANPHRPAITCRPEIPPQLSELIDRLLEKSPEHRPASAHQVAAELAEIVGISGESMLVPQLPGGLEKGSLGGDTTDTTDTTESFGIPAIQRSPSGSDQPMELSHGGLTWLRQGPGGRGRRWGLALLLVAILGAGLTGLTWRPWLDPAPPDSTPSADPIPEAPSSQAAAEPDSYALFQQGMKYLERFDKPGNLDRAVAAFEAALAQEERSAPAHAGLALAYWRQYLKHYDPQRLEQALTIAERAVQLDEHLALARAASGTIHAEAGDSEGALSELRMAFQLDPMNAEAHRGLGMVHESQGRTAEAITAYEKAAELDPEDSSLRDTLGASYYRAAHYAEAEKEFLVSIELAPDSTA